MSKNNIKSGAEEVRRKAQLIDEVQQLLNFIETESPRGVSRKREGIESEMDETDAEKNLLFPDLPELGI
jgi:hypothetical protein